MKRLTNEQCSAANERSELDEQDDRLSLDNYGPSVSGIVVRILCVGVAMNNIEHEIKFYGILLVIVVGSAIGRTVTNIWMGLPLSVAFGIFVAIYTERRLK